jgi:hypothetical protein
MVKAFIIAISIAAQEHACGGRLPALDDYLSCGCRRLTSRGRWDSLADIRHHSVGQAPLATAGAGSLRRVIQRRSRPDPFTPGILRVNVIPTARPIADTLNEFCARSPKADQEHCRDE